MNQEHVIKTVSYSQEEILSWILQLYVPSGVFDLDPTYSKGVFYKGGIPEPRFKFDLFPQSPDIRQADAGELTPEHVGWKSLQSIIFDPPFIGGSRKKGKPGVIKSRFGCCPTIPKLWSWYRQCLFVFYGLLRAGGVLVFKCQDSIESRKQYLSHIKIINLAVAYGFYPKDLFVLCAKHRIIGVTHKKQQHARKYHSYFLVFEKGKRGSPIEYRAEIPNIFHA